MATTNPYEGGLIQSPYPSGLLALPDYGVDPYYLSGIFGAAPPPEEDPWDFQLGKVVMAGLQGYASGFLALPFGDENPTNHIERLVRQMSSLAGFIGFGFPIFGSVLGKTLGRVGMTSAAQAVSTFRSVPMFAGDFVLDKVAKGKLYDVITNTALKGSDLGRQLVRTGVHLGTASAVSALHQGVGEAAYAGLHGMALAVATGGIGNIPMLRERTTPAGILRAASGAAVNIGMMGSYAKEAHWTDVAFQGVLGAYFGYIQPTAQMARAQEFMFKDLPKEARTASGGFDRGYVYGAGSPIWSLPKNVKAEVDHMMNTLYAEGDMASGFGHVVKAMNGDREAPKEKPLASYSTDLASVLREVMRLAETHPPRSPGTTDLFEFGKKVYEKGSAKTGWRVDELARMIDSYGEIARQRKDDGGTYGDFIADVKKGFSNAGLTYEAWEPYDLARYYNAKMSQQRVPVVGWENGKAVPLSPSGLHFDGSRIDDLMPMSRLHLQGAMLLEDVTSPEQVMFYMNGMKRGFGEKRSLSENAREVSQALFSGDIWDGLKRFTVPSATLDGGRVPIELFGSDGKTNFYASSGTGTKDSVLFMRYLLDPSRDVADQFTALKGEFLEAANKRRGKGDPEITEKDIDRALDATFSNHMTETGLGLESRAEWERQMVSNANWFKVTHLGDATTSDPWNVPLSKMAEGQFVGTLADFNKRLQPFLTSFYPIADEFLPEGVRYVISPDLNAYVKTATGRFIDVEVSDGATIITRALYDRLAPYLGYPSEGSSIKPFIVQGDKDLGTLLGKTAFHVASAQLEKAMTATGVDMILYESSAKQRGKRTSRAIDIGDDGKLLFGDITDTKRGWVEWGKDAPIYNMKASDIMVSPASHDATKQGTHLMKQTLTMMVPELVGRDGSGRFSRALGQSRIDSALRAILDDSMKGTPEARDALNAYSRDPSEANIVRLFGTEAERRNKNVRVLAEDADPIGLLEVISKPGNERAFESFVDMIVRRDDLVENMRVNDHDQDMTLFDEGEAADARVFGGQLGSAGEAILARSMGKLGATTHKASRRLLDMLISSWVVDRISRPYVKSAVKSVMKPYDLGHATLFGYDEGGVVVGGRRKKPKLRDSEGNVLSLTENNFIAENGLLSVRVPYIDDAGQRVTKKIGALVSELKKARAAGEDDRVMRIENALSVTSTRSPAIDPSAVRENAWLGTTGTRGFGTVLHGKTMRKEGGADLDIDTTTLYWGLPTQLRDLFRMTRDADSNWNDVAVRSVEGLTVKDVDGKKVPHTLTGEKWTRVHAFLDEPEGIPALSSKNPAVQLVGMFDSYQRVRLGLEVARGRMGMAATAVSGRTHMHTLYSHVASQQDRKTSLTVLGTPWRLELTARDDGGALLRSFGDAATTASVDVAKFGAMVSRDKMRAILFQGAFEKADLVHKDGRRLELMEDLAVNERGTVEVPEALLRFTSSEGIKEDGVKLRLSGTLYKQMTDATAGLFGRNYAENRSWTLDERISLAKRWPTADGGSIAGTVGHMSQYLASVRSPLRDPLDYAIDNYDSYVNARSMWAASLKSKIGSSLLGFMEDPDTSAMPQEPYVSTPLSKMLETMKALREDRKLTRGGDLASYDVRERIVLDDGYWSRLQEGTLESRFFNKGEFFNRYPREDNGATREDVYRWRRAKLSEVFRRVSDFVSNDFDDMAALMTMRDYYVASGLKKSEAHSLVARAADLKRRAAKAFAERLGREEEDLTASDRTPGAEGDRIARDDYLQFMAGGGLRRLVDEWNADTTRRTGEDPMLSYEAVANFYDAAMLSPWFVKDGSYKSRSRNFGMDLISNDVLGRFLMKYDTVFNQSMTGRKVDGTATFEQLLEGDLSFQRAAQLRQSFEVEAFKLDTKKKWDDLNPTLRKELTGLQRAAEQFPIFRDDPKKLVGFVTDLAQVAQPKDLSISDVAMARRKLERFQNGYGFFNWIMKVKYGKEAAKEMWSPAYSLFFPSTTGDLMMAKDMMLHDRQTRANPVLKKTYEKDKDGVVHTRLVMGHQTMPMSTFHRLIEINGEQKNRLRQSMSEELAREWDQRTAWMRGDIVHETTGKNVSREVIQHAIHDMEMRGAERANDTGNYRLFDVRRSRSYGELVDALGFKRSRNTKTRANINDQTFTWVDASGQPRRGNHDTLKRSIQASVEDAFKTISKRHITADEWVKEHRDILLTKDGTELDLTGAFRMMDEVFRLGVASRGHIPLDAARLLFYEDVLARVAKNEPMPEVMSEDRVMQGGKYREWLVRRRILNLGERINSGNLEEIAARVYARMKRSEENLSEEQLAEYKDVADYFHRPVYDDMRGTWMGKDYLSRWEDDLAVSQGRITKEEYKRRILRDVFPLYATKLEDGYWPHLGFDPQQIKVQTAKRIDRMANPPTGKRTKNKDAILKDARALSEHLREALSRTTDPDGRALDDVAALHIEENSIAFLKNFGRNSGHLAQRKMNLDGYRTDLGVFADYADQLSGATYGNIASLQSRGLILDFEARKPMGKWTEAWAKWMRIYMRDTMGKPTVFTKEYLEDEQLQLKRTPYYWLSDHQMLVGPSVLNRALLRITKAADVTEADRAVFRIEHGRDMSPDEAKEIKEKRIGEFSKIGPDGPTAHQAKVMGEKYRGMSELEAKYEMMSLLFHSKTIATNMIGGTVNSIINNGWRNFADAAKLETWQKLAPGRFKSMDDVYQLVYEQGVVENWIVNDFMRQPRYRTDEAYRRAVDGAIDKLSGNPLLKDETLGRILRESGLSDRMAELAAKPMRWSERKLRSHAFLAGLLQARRALLPVQLPIDHPYLIEMGRKSVATSQFLYDAANRPAFSRTSLGKIYSRFKIWSWSSVKMRREIFQAAKDSGFSVGSPDQERLRRLIQADMFAVSLASFFPFTIFETAGLPAPYNWMKDTAEYFFGDDFEQESAFYGSPIGPLNELSPVVLSKMLNASEEVFHALVSDEKDTMSMYPIAAMFPFGRMANDVYRSLQTPTEAPKYLLGLPLRDFENQKKAMRRRNLFRETAPMLAREAIEGASSKEIIAAFEDDGYTAAQARQMLNEGMKQGLLAREMNASTRAYRYYTVADENTLKSILRNASSDIASQRDYLASQRSETAFLR